MKPRSRKSFDGSKRWPEPPAMGRTSPTLRRAWPRDGPLAAICVQNVDVQCVLQFTLIHAAGCVLHRRTSRVIHRLKLSFCYLVLSDRSHAAAQLPEATGRSRRKEGPSGWHPKCFNERKVGKKEPGRHRLRTPGLFKPSPGRREACGPQLPPQN